MDKELLQQKLDQSNVRYEAAVEKEWKKVCDERHRMGSQYRNKHITLEEYESRDKKVSEKYREVRKEALRICEEEMESIYNEY